ncbi:MAG: hypothetical protein ACWA5U_08305 [bacterium]
MLSTPHFSQYYQKYTYTYYKYKKRPIRFRFGRGLKILLVTALLIALSFLSACQSQHAEKQVTEAAQARWQALIQGDFKRAYPYYTTAYQETTPFDHFKHSIRGVGMWNAADVLSVSCEAPEKQCQAKLEISVVSKMRGLDKPLKTSTILEETWRYEGFFKGWKFVKK